MSVVPAQPRETVQVRFPDGRVFDGRHGTPLEAFVKAAALPRHPRVLAALADGRLRELTLRVEADVSIVPVTMADSDGVRIYRRSLSFLMIAAAADVFPDDTISIQHSMPFGGYYCERTCPTRGETQPSISPDDLARLKRRMQALVAAALPIRHVRVPLAAALKVFQETGDLEKADLFAKRRKDYLTLYELNGVQDYFHGFMVPSTAYLDLFDLRPYNRGFILQFPRRQQPDRLQPFEDEPRLAQVFQDYSRWLSLIGTSSVAALNRAVRESRIQEVILVAEALHQMQLGAIAAEIARRKDVKLVLISGPTSAGKTTFSKRLAVQLLAHGIQPLALAIDNYFVDREHTPRDENGDYDFEAFEAVDSALLQQQVRDLLAGRTVVQPRYNFVTGSREWDDELAIGPQHILVIEGIHGLNPNLVAGIPGQSLYRVFISAFTQLNLDRHNRVPTTDTRLLRRIVRDARARGYDAAATIRRWQSVRRGEKNYIFPHQNNADVFFNSALVYELSVLKSLAEPLLLQVEPGTPERVEANRLLAFLQWFDPIGPDGIPSDSILREFIGHSIMEDFHPWRR